MKTVEIVSGLVAIALKYEWYYNSDEGEYLCNECDSEEHKPDCGFSKLVNAAGEYLHLMEGSKK